MVAVVAMLLAFCALIGAGFSFIAGASWLGLGLIILSTALEAFAFLWVGREEAAE
jgi:hypothetical protein